MHRGFGEQVVDDDPFVIVVDYPRGGERGGRGDVGTETIATEEGGVACWVCTWGTGMGSFSP